MQAFTSANECSDARWGDSPHLALSTPESDLARLKLENALLRASLSVSSAPQNSKHINRSAETLKRLIMPKWSSARVQTPAIMWNAEQDRHYAHKLPGYDRVLHIFSQQWLGIRAAAGSLPGQKLAIDNSAKLSKDDFRSVIHACDRLQIERFVFHGMSRPIAHLITQLAQCGLSSRLFIVYHGNVVQWCYEPEQELAAQAIALAKSGAVKRIHFMKRGHDFLADNSYSPLLLNMSPRVVEANIDVVSNTVLIPASADWRKNLNCNALGAAITEGIDRVLHFSPAIRLPSPYHTKLERTQHIDRATTLRLMSHCRATLNVSLAECHPMVCLESEAVGTPCLRNPLLLDAHEDHPYVRLVEVSDTASPAELSKVLRRVLDTGRQETAGLIRDYLDRVNSTSAQRYAEFLEL